MSDDRYDVYAWPINGRSRLVARNVDYEKAEEIFNKYFDRGNWDAYIVAAGTQFFM